MLRLLSAAISLLLWASYVAVAFAVGLFADADLPDAFGVAQVYLACVCALLVPLAYPRPQRKWWQWILWPALGLTVGLIPIVWLPWTIVRRRAAARAEEARTPP
jgi:hypothetical protein